MTEDEVRRLLDARTATIDPLPLPLADITRLGRRRHRRQRVLQVGGVAAVVAAVAIGGVALRNALAGSAPSTVSHVISGLPGQPPTRSQLLGTWRAVSIHGRDVTHEPPHLRPSLLLHLAAESSRPTAPIFWSGTDLCNKTSGLDTLGADGSFRLRQANRPQIGCPLPPSRLSSAVVRAVLQTSWVRVENRELVLWAAPGHELARFVHTTGSPGR